MLLIDDATLGCFCGNAYVPMENGRVCLSSMKTGESAERTTPDWLFRNLDGMFHFGLDAAATAENAKCAKFLTQEEDALKMPWQGYGPVFLNPPYSRGQLKLWMEKAASEATTGTVVVSIVPGDFGTGWFATIWRNARFVLFLRGRVKFNGISTGAKFPTVIAVFGPSGYTGPLDCPRCSLRALENLIVEGSKAIRL